MPSAADLLRWTLRGIARTEGPDGLKPPRLTEPGHVHWHRLRRRLGWRDFIALLHEDLAGAFPTPFELASWFSHPLASLSEADAEKLVQDAAAHTASSDALRLLRSAAHDLELPAGGQIASLEKVQPGQKVLELPGSAGRIAIQQARSHGAGVDDQFTYVVASDAERVVLGLAMLELRARPPKVWTVDQAKAAIRAGARFDRVLGVHGSTVATELVQDCKLEARWAS